MKKDKIAIGCDPNASELKNVLRDHIVSLGHEVKDFGNEDPIYANTAFAVAEAVATGEYTRGVLLCGTGIGVCLAANKVFGALAVNCSDAYSVERSIKSNNANILTLGSQVMGVELAKTLVTNWLSYTYETGGRSDAKNQRIKEYELAHTRNTK
jgi:ribose 5-phosphate isomerase B